LEERAEHATRLEAELRETRSALAKAGDVQKQLANLEERLAAAGVTPRRRLVGTEDRPRPRLSRLFHAARPLGGGATLWRRQE